MLREKWNAGVSLRRVKLLPVVLLSFAQLACPMMAKAQNAGTGTAEGRISGTVLLNADHRPASQVMVDVRCFGAGIYRSLLTDGAGHFELRGIPPGNCEIVVNESGYEPARASEQVDGHFAEVVIYLKSSTPGEIRRNSGMVSMHELKIPGKALREFQRGLQGLARNDLGEANTRLRKAIQAFPDYYEAYYYQGALEMKLGQREEAMQAFQTAIDLSGGRYAPAEFGMGYLLYLQGNAREAEGVIRRGLEVDENAASGYAILGLIQLRLTHIDEAEKSAEAALRRDAHYALAYLVLADVQASRNNYQMQLRELEAYLKLEPAGLAHDRVAQAREAILKKLAELHAQN